ncbi:TIP120-domain-containing protein [Microstroma glucosiphilum]|uniref:TIP120-domain-containing protein n=1 Tax=Pseudomicrostroma glucosiphilum TaxID=1684307 RepID=A0A316UAH3_9BASI|nr:TIP120-domain-containing protein [Pseudomicrostroma glucosiphilum]PWN22206.1 TIP120-domain-containing protein [Pseudomicrostroma glucosiphilum]
MSRVSSSSIAALLEKMKSQDADFRFMALNDLISDARRDSFAMDDDIESKVVSRVLELLKDPNGEVKNMAVRCLGMLVRRVRERQMQVVIDYLVVCISSKEEEVRDIAALGLKTVIAEMPSHSNLARSATTTLAPKLLAEVKSPAASQELLIDSLDVLAEIFTRFSSTILENSQLQKLGLQSLLPLLEHSRVAVRKRATLALSVLAANSSSETFTQLSTTASTSLSSSDVDKRKTSVQLIGALARSSPRRVGRRLPEFMPKIIEAAGTDDDELRETTLQTMELALLRCPMEVTPFLTSVVGTAVESIKHDPNYAGGDDSDEEMTDDFEEDDDDLEGDEDYSDDDDMSWKVRRAAAKTLQAAINTRHELLATFLTRVAPVLVSRFSEREESVRLEVLQTFLALLRQIQLFVGLPQATEVRPQSPGALKRKRDNLDAEEGSSPQMQLRALVPVISKALLKELPSKSSGTRLISTSVFKELVVVLQGGLDAQIPSIVAQINKALKTAETATGAGSSLKSEIISFLRVLFVAHNSRSYQDQLPTVIPILAGAITGRAHRDSVEALEASSDMIAAIYKQDASSLETSLLISLYDAVVSRLKGQDSDQELREKAVACLGMLLSSAGAALGSKLDECLPLLVDRLKNEVTRFATVKVVAQIASSPACQGPAFGAFFQSCTDEVTVLLRQSSRPLKLAAFEALEALLIRLGTELQGNTGNAIVMQIAPLLAEDADLSLLPQALAKPEVLPSATDAFLSHLSFLLAEPLVQGTTLDAIVDFIQVTVTVEGQRALEILHALTATLDHSTGSHAYSNAARCVGGIANAAPSNIEAIISGAGQALKAASQGKEAATAFNLLILGEVGRLEDFMKHPDLVKKVYDAFESPINEVRSSAAFALGNMAVGNEAAFLPVIRGHIENVDKHSLLALAALKELITHGSTEQLTVLAEQIWVPLFGICQTKDEATRSIGAECLARLTLTDPAKYLVQLQGRLRDPSASTRAAVIAAIRFSLTEASPVYNELLGPSIVDFLCLLKDPDLDVRRHAMFAFNSAAHNKPQLIREHLSTLLPLLYQETHVRQELLRKVTMGPFTVIQDDGLDLRKNAYETMYTLLDTCLTQINVSEYLNRVIAGLRDDDQVKLLCYLILVRLTDLAPLQVSQALDEISDPINESLKVKLKDGSTKQDVEKSAELTRAAFRALIALQRLLAGGSQGGAAMGAPRFQQLLKEAKGGPSAGLFREAEAAAASQQRI